jgi:hypothetical protein
LNPSIRRRLSFEVGPSGAHYDFRIINQVCGIGVGVDLGDYPRHVLKLFQSKDFFRWQIEGIVEWCGKLGVELKEFYVQFVFPGMHLQFGQGKAIVGRRGRVLLQILSDLCGESLAIDDIVCEHNKPGQILCETVIPHELMHILQVRSGRSPSVYPFMLFDQGEWLDLLLHLWIDGDLEARGLPHLPKQLRVRQLAEEVGSEKAESLTAKWWGKSMTLHDAVGLGIQAGLPLKPDSPIAIWYRNLRD